MKPWEKYGAQPKDDGPWNKYSAPAPVDPDNVPAPVEPKGAGNKSDITLFDYLFGDTTGQQFLKSRLESIKKSVDPETWKGIASDMANFPKSDLSNLGDTGEVSADDKRRIQGYAMSFFPVTRGVNVAGEAGRKAYDFIRPKISEDISPVASWLMRSAIKPTVEANKSGDAKVAVETLIRKGWNPTRGGVEKIKERISDLGDEVSDIIKSSVEKVNVGTVSNALSGTRQKFSNQVSPSSDLRAIQNVADDFAAHPDIAGRSEIPVQLAQKLKQGTYNILNKKYGQVGTAETEAQKALARGLKEEINRVAPEVVPRNAEEAILFKTLDVVERRALMELNKNPGGLVWLAQNPKAAAGFLFDRSALFKSIIARMVNSISKPIRGTTNALDVNPSAPRFIAEISQEE